jgi:peroxiredoxin
LERGPVVLSFFLGGWSPYCALAMRAMQAWLPQFERFGAQVVAIAPEAMTEELLDYRVVIDREGAVARKFGIVVRLAGEIIEVYRQLGFNVPPVKGRDEMFVPLPATFVIDRQRTIRYAFVNPDFRRRAEPADIAAALATI